jgi:hypothetical protein
MKTEFSRQSSKNTEISNFMKIRRVGPSCSTRTDGPQTYRHDAANSRLSQFCERAYERAM